MHDIYQRTEMLIGADALAKLKNSRVLICGIGGVGSYIAEALARAGVGAIDLLDFDTVAPSNINRQIIALTSTIGQYKTDVMAERIRDINPEITVTAHKCFIDETNVGEILSAPYTYIADAIDSVPSKLALIRHAKEADINIISSMGTGNKLDPTRFKIADISKTSVCPLARKMRGELKKAGITHHKVLFSDELPIKPDAQEGRHPPASISFVPSVAGLIIAGEIVRDLIK